MGCCIAIAFVIAVVRRAWYAVRLGQAPTEVLFAPSARRAGPGETAPPSRPAARARERTRWGPILLGAGAVWTGLGILAMHVFGLRVALVADLAVHGAGLAAMATGALVGVASSSRVAGS